MRHRIAIGLLMTVLAGCAGGDGGNYSVFFMPYSSQLDQKALDTIQSAATFAKANPPMPITIQGYTTRPDPTEHDSLRELRVAVVKNGLLNAGVGSMRIEVLGNGLIYPQGVPMPTLPSGRVEIHVGL